MEYSSFWAKNLLNSKKIPSEKSENFFFCIIREILLVNFKFFFKTWSQKCHKMLWRVFFLIFLKNFITRLLPRGYPGTQFSNLRVYLYPARTQDCNTRNRPRTGNSLPVATLLGSNINMYLSWYLNIGRMWNEQNYSVKILCFYFFISHLYVTSNINFVLDI